MDCYAGSLGHVRPCCNLGLDESKVLAPGTHRRPIVIEGKIHSFVGDKNSCTCDWSRTSLPGNRATSQGIDGRTDHSIVLPINLAQLLQGLSMPFKWYSYVNGMRLYKKKSDRRQLTENQRGQMWTKMKTKGVAARKQQPLEFTWCRRSETNRHGVAAAGF